MPIAGQGTEFLHGIELIRPNIFKIIAISQVEIMYLQAFQIICNAFSGVPHHCVISVFSAIIQTYLLGRKSCIIPTAKKVNCTLQISPSNPTYTKVTCTARSRGLSLACILQCFHHKPPLFSIMEGRWAFITLRAYPKRDFFMYAFFIIQDSLNVDLYSLPNKINPK